MRSAGVWSPATVAAVFPDKVSATLKDGSRKEIPTKDLQRYIRPASVALRVDDYTPKADMWSLGVTAFELLFDERPFPFSGSTDADKDKVLKLVLKYEDFSELEREFRKLRVWNERSDEARSFLEGLLEKDPEKRLSAAEALLHPWIRTRSSLAEGPDSLGSFIVKGLSGYQDAPVVIRCSLF